MRILLFLSLALFFLSCQEKGETANEKRVFIVSEFNNEIEKRTQLAIAKNPELSKIKEIKTHDYPKETVDFIFLNDGTVYVYNEELIWNWCGWDPGAEGVEKRKLPKDSLHQINYTQIYPLLKNKSFEKSMRNDRNMLHHLSFSFEKDTIRNYDIYKLLHDIDSLGYHSYNIRNISAFEINAIKK